MTIPTNRPFFANFLAAFRAQSTLQKATAGVTSATSPSAFTPSSTPPAPATATSTLTASAAVAAAAARSLATKAATPPQAIAGASAQRFQAARQHTASPPSRSPGSPAGGGGGYHAPLGAAARRRGSDSDGEGFRDAYGGEKWYVGGRAADGEERFYKLSVVKRPRSVDRLSMDRLSL